MLVSGLALMHQVQGVVDQLSGLFGGHGNCCGWSPLYPGSAAAAVARATRLRSGSQQIL